LAPGFAFLIFPRKQQSRASNNPAQAPIPSKHPTQQSNIPTRAFDAPEAPAFSQIRLHSPTVFHSAANSATTGKTFDRNEDRPKPAPNQTRAERDVVVDENKTTLVVESGARVRRTLKNFSTGFPRQSQSGAGKYRFIRARIRGPGSKNTGPPR
jgi:hypothetical protein